MNAGLLGVALVLALALTRPQAPLLGGAGLAAMAGAVLTWRDPGPMYGLIPDGFTAAFTAVLLIGGALLVWLAYARRRDEVPPRAWRLVGVVAAAALMSWVLPIMGSEFDAIRLHQAARGWPSTVVLPLALAGAMLWSARKALRVASAVAVVASLAAGAVGSQAGGMTPVASLPGRFFGDEPQGSWSAGWHQSGPVAVRLDPVDAIRIAGPDGAHAHLLSASDRAAAGVWYQAAPTAAMRVEPMDQATGTSTIRIYPIH